MVAGLPWVGLPVHPVAETLLRLCATPALVVQVCCGVIAWNLVMIYVAEYRIHGYHQGSSSIARSHQRLCITVIASTLTLCAGFLFQ